MTAAQWISLTLAALLVFWMVGAYNRLVALRTTIGEACRQVDDGVQRRSAAAQAIAAATRGAMAGEGPALDAWLAAQAQAQQAAAALRARPVSSQLASALTAAEAPLAAADARVMALLDQHPAVLTDPAVAEPLAALRRSHEQLVFSRHGYNEAAQTYNDAVRMLPTRLLARLYGFGTAGRL